MKKTDIAMIILIASVSILIAYFVANSIFGNVSKDSVKVKTIDSINFNTNAINPAIEVQISGNK